MAGCFGPTGFNSQRFWPQNQNKGGEDYDPISIAFASDLHMGSKEFLEKEWILWWNG